MSLLNQIKARIAAQGPMRLDEYMQTCLLHPTLGYYTTREAFGSGGDFTTAPEISQMFGELLGLSLAQSWLSQGAPQPFTLAELGPGRGTLMADVLRAGRGVPGFVEAAQVVLVEASPKLRAQQRETLAPHLAQHDVTWCDSVAELPRQPLFLLANEFFDALPIRQFLRVGDGWRERQIGLDGDALTFGLGPALPQPALEHRLANTDEGDLIELCDSAAPIMAALAERIAEYGGTALVIDYGDWASKGDTFQAVARHSKVDPLATPGQADLTAHVDFAFLAAAARNCAVSHMTPQGVFLERLGITARAQTLARGMQDAALDSHIAAHRRLTHPEEMGNLFKVLGITPRNVAPPPGLEP